MDALLASGQPEKALALCGRALAVQEQVGLLAADRVYEWDALRCQGEALLALGRPLEALAPLERGLTLTRRTDPEDLNLTRAALVRARAAAGRGVARSP